MNYSDYERRIRMSKAESGASLIFFYFSFTFKLFLEPTSEGEGEADYHSADEAGSGDEVGKNFNNLKVKL